MTLRTRLALSMILTLSACTNHTQLVVAVESDLGIPDELDQVRLVVTGPSGTPSEAMQMLEGPGAETMPLTLGVRPFGEALGPVEVRAEGLVDGAVVVMKSARTTLIQGETRTLVLFLARDCVGVSCAQGQTCQERVCVSDEVDPESLPRWSGQVPTRDGGISDGGPRPDAEVADQTCTSDDDCRDSFECTEDTCVDGACVREPNDALCTDSRAGTCDIESGCQYPLCVDEDCNPRNACETAQCNDEGVCERQPVCAEGEGCCAGTCGAPGCDDGNPCTDDQCGAEGCEHIPNTGNLCDDGEFCNGADTCVDGMCAEHAGNPCSGDTHCNEELSACTGCLVDADCPPARVAVSECGGYDAANVCDETGTRTRSTTTYTCNDAGMCVAETTDETESCRGRSTDGRSCGDSRVELGTCTGYSTPCDESGTRTRTQVDFVCAGGTCNTDRTSLSNVSCSRNTDGDHCVDPRACIFGEECTNGYCRGISTCLSGRICSLDGVCRCPGETLPIEPESSEPMELRPPPCELEPY